MAGGWSSVTRLAGEGGHAGGVEHFLGRPVHADGSSGREARGRAELGRRVVVQPDTPDAGMKAQETFGRHLV